MNVHEFINKLDGVRRSGGGWTARCPNHEDNRNSLSVKQGDNGSVLLFCHANCATPDIVSAMGLEMKDLQAESFQIEEPERCYTYCDAAGKKIYQAVRKPGKKFSQRAFGPVDGTFIYSMEGVTRVPYRLPELLASNGDVFIVEGEKDADRLTSLGLTATCNVAGAGKWLDSYNEHFRGRKVFILPDNDKAGMEHASKVFTSLSNVAKSVKVIEIPGLLEKQDVTDWLDAGHKVDELLALCKGVKVIDLADATCRFLDDIRDHGEERLLRTGISDLDEAIGGGIAEGEIVIIGARPSHGKSMICLQLLHEMTRHQPAMMMSEEMSIRAIAKRSVQYASDVPQEYWFSRTSEVKEEVIDHFADRKPLYVVESSRTVDAVARTIREMKDEHEVSLVAIDYLQLLQSSSKNDRYKDVTETSIAMKQIATEHSITMILLCQLSREIEKRPKWYPKLSDLRESGQIEQDADVVLFLLWPYKVKSSEDPKKFMLFVGKNRNREIVKHQVEFRFEPSRQRLQQRDITHHENYNDAFDAFA